MKTAKKLFGMVLSLSLVLTLLCGITAAAATNLIEGKAWNLAEGSTAATEADGVLTLPLSASEAMVSDGVNVKEGTSYQLSFTYTLPAEGKGTVKVCGFQNTRSTPVVEVTALPAAENKTCNMIFTVGRISKDTTISTVKVTFASVIVENSTENFVVKDIALTIISDAAVLANGSAEVLDEENKPIGITGGELVQTGAKDGQNRMRVTASAPMEMRLAIPAANALAKIRGYVMAESFNAASVLTISVKDAYGDGAVLATKDFNLAPAGEAAADEKLDIAAGEWEYFRFSSVQQAAALVLSFEVTGNGAVYVDGVTIEKDNNLIANANFASTAGWTSRYYSSTGGSWKDLATEGNDEAIQTDGNCPDGQNYILFDKSSGTSTSHNAGVRYKSQYQASVIDTRILVNGGEKYSFTFWVKSNAKTFMGLVPVSPNNYDPGNAEHTSPGIYSGGGTQANATLTNSHGSHIMEITVPSTGGEWQQISYTASIPTGVTQIYPMLSGAIYSTTVDLYAAFCMPTLEKVEEDALGFYKERSDVKGYNWYADSFVKVLGEPVETATGYTDALTAKLITPEAQETSTDIVILAAYSTLADGTKKLENVAIGNTATAPVLEAFMVETVNEVATELHGVNYPSATLPADENSESTTEIRAFAWDDISGLKPAGNYATLTK